MAVIGIGAMMVSNLNATTAVDSLLHIIVPEGVFVSKPRTNRGMRIMKVGGVREGKTKDYRKWEGPLSVLQCTMYDWGCDKATWGRAPHDVVEYDELLAEATGIMMDKATEGWVPRKARYTDDAIEWETQRRGQDEEEMKWDDIWDDWSWSPAHDNVWVSAQSYFDSDYNSRMLCWR